MGAQPDVVAQGHIFSKIMLGGSVAIILLFLINGIYRGAGDAAMAMRSLWIASGLNMICPIMIYRTGLMAGVWFDRGSYCHHYWAEFRGSLPVLPFI